MVHTANLVASDWENRTQVGQTDRLGKQLDRTSKCRRGESRKHENCLMNRQCQTKENSV